MSTEIFIYMTQTPVYDHNVKGDIHVKLLSRSKNYILNELSKQQTNISSIIPCNFPFQISPNTKQNGVYVAPFDVLTSDKTLYVLEFEISNDISTYTSIICSTSSDHIMVIATDWFDDESAGLFDDEFELMIDELNKFGRYEFEGYGKHLKILIYTFDLETEIVA